MDILWTHSKLQAEENIHCQCMNHEYAPIGGEATFTKAVAKLAFGENNKVLKEKSNCTVQVSFHMRHLHMISSFLCV